MRNHRKFRKLKSNLLTVRGSSHLHISMCPLVQDGHGYLLARHIWQPSYKMSGGYLPARCIWQPSCKMHILSSLRCTCYLLAKYTWLPSCMMYLVNSMRNAHDYLSARYTCYSYCRMCMVTLEQNVLGCLHAGVTVLLLKR